jgi:hypothetical protein
VLNSGETRGKLPHLVSSGLSLEIVGRLLGHTNPATTQRGGLELRKTLAEKRDLSVRFGEPVALLSFV